MSDTQGRTARGRAGDHATLRLAAATLARLAALGLAQEGEEVPTGIGPIAVVELGEIDPQRVAGGQATFESLCSACHRFGERYVGPDLRGVTQRRAPEWIMNMVLNTNVMLFEDDTAYGLLAEYMTPMPQLPLTEEQVRDVLEFFRYQDSQVGN